MYAEKENLCVWQISYLRLKVCLIFLYYIISIILGLVPYFYFILLKCDFFILIYLLVILHIDCLFKYVIYMYIHKIQKKYSYLFFCLVWHSGVYISIFVIQPGAHDFQMFWIRLRLIEQSPNHLPRAVAPYNLVLGKFCRFTFHYNPINAIWHVKFTTITLLYAFIPLCLWTCCPLKHQLLFSGCMLRLFFIKVPFW